MLLVYFALWYEIIKATARAGAFVPVKLRASETSPVWCGRKDLMQLDAKTHTETAVMSGLANPSPLPALTALNNFNELNLKKNIRLR